MPVAIPLIGLAVSAGMGGLQMAQANKAKKEAQKNIDNFKRQDLTNPANGMQVSTLGADRQREDLARTMATYANLASMGGTRGIAALAPSLISQQNTQEAQIAANLDEQQKQIDQLKANGQMQIQNMQEQRDNADLAGLGTQLDLANAQAVQAKNSFVGGLVNGVTNVASAGLNSMANGNGFFGKTSAGLVPTGNLNLASMMPNYRFSNPVQLNSGGYNFGNNTNGFLSNNFQTPQINYPKLF